MACGLEQGVWLSLLQAQKRVVRSEIHFYNVKHSSVHMQKIGLMLLCCFLEKSSHISCIRKHQLSVLSLMNELGVLQHSPVQTCLSLSKRDC